MQPAGPHAPARILVVDDEPGNRELMTRLLAREGYEVHTASDGESAMAFIRTSDPVPDLILLDVMMPGINGFAVCRQIKQDPATRLTPVVMLTSLDARAHRIEGIKAGADDFLTKPVQFEELTARAASLIKLKRFTDDLESAESVIVSLAQTVEARDPYTEGHCLRLAAYASIVGRAIGLSADDIAALERGGYLHDVGKIGIPDAILLKPNALTREEFEQMKSHTIIGERLCGRLRSLRSVRSIVRHHHERLDGTGYPDGLRGDQVPVTAQIVGIADAYDSMTTTRPYRQALPVSHARDELLRDANEGRFDVALVRAFLDIDPEAAARAAAHNALRSPASDAVDPERIRHSAGGHRRDP